MLSTERSTSGLNSISRFVTAVGTAPMADNTGSIAIQCAIGTNSGSPSRRAAAGAPRYTTTPKIRDSRKMTVFMVSK